MLAKDERRFTKSNVESLLPDPTGNRFYTFTNVPQGLVLQVTPAGAKSFVLRYRFHGRQKIHTLGRFPGMSCDAAHKAAVAAWDQINRGIDPNAKKAAARQAEREAVTMEKLVDRFKSEHMKLKNKPSTILVHGRYLDQDIKPALGKLKVKAVTKTDIAELLFTIQAEGKATKAYTVARILSKMFAKAELWGLIEPGTNPARGQDQAQPVKRDRRLNDHELFELGRALREDKKEDIYALAAFQIYLLTGMRRSELLGDVQKGIPPLTWDQVDLKTGVVHLKHHKTDRQVGSRAVLLCKPAVAILETLKKAKLVGNPCVIPGAKPGRSRTTLHDSWKRIKDAAGIPDVRLHDLRRTFVSVGADLGLPDYFADAQVGHAAGTVTDVYRRVGRNPLFDAVEAIGGRIALLLSGELDPNTTGKAPLKVQRNRRKK